MRWLAIILLALAPSYSFGAIAYAGNNAYTGNNATSRTSNQTPAFGSSTTAGNAILVWLTFNGGTADATGCTDLNGDSFTLGTPVDLPSVPTHLYINYAVNIAAGSGNQVTCSTTGSHTFFAVYAEEWSGIATSSPFDNQVSNLLGSAGTSNTVAITTAVANELIVVISKGTSGFVSWTPGTGFSKVTNTTASSDQGSEVQVVTTATSYNAAASWTNSIVNVIVAAAFKPAVATHCNSCDMSGMY